MKTFAEFETWFNSELQKYPLIAKSNPLSLNELCYILRMSESDFAVSYSTPTGFHCIPSVKMAFIPSWELAQKIEIVGFDADLNYITGKNDLCVVVRILA